ncbi:hypothetical protein [Nesterenkonia sphaerica]|uniref:DUF4064 domain-containing protein n=1 Tax=Nesterenkonia sphaerica TaxID=1804988 RepID=A0A5R9A5Z3_9MICC|nr:hypothetical protein [Nesterenkonia sphaerica]TLP74093.1 hypothetical protein FEF27_10105 [Nesterenkonia sphaerica]
MSTPPNNEPGSQDSPGDGEPGRTEPRPQPRYGAYAPPDGAAPAGHGSAGESGHGRSAETDPHPGGQYNPYAQPAWGQADWQQGDNVYPYGGGPQSGYHPQPSPSAAQRPARPGALWGVLAALLAAGVTALLWGIYIFATIPGQTMDEVFGGAFSQTFVEEMERQSTQDPDLQNLSAQEMEEVTLLGIGVFALVWGFVLLALYVTTAFLGSMAGNPGRVLATIWSGLSLLFLLLGYDAISYGLIFATVGLSIAAIVLMWLPGSSRYIRYRRWEKEVSRGGHYGNPAPQL